MTAPVILTSRLSPLQLTGFQNCFFDESGIKFFGYTLLSVTDPAFEELYYSFLHQKNYSFTKKEEGAEDDERYRIYNEDGTFTYKKVPQLVAEGIFRYVSLQFFGILYRNEWFILDECRYFENRKEEHIRQVTEEPWQSSGEGWSSHLFKPVSEIREEIDFAAVSEILSKKLEREIDRLQDRERIWEYLNSLEASEVPKKKTKQFPSYREFVGQSWLVAQIKQERKSRINRSFEAYFNEAVFLPFIQSLKNSCPDEFQTTEPLYHSEYYPLIYPHSKEHVLCVVKARNELGISRLYYFLYLSAQMRFYEWVLPLPRPVEGHHAFYIQEDLKDLSVWGEEFDLSEPSITMDDPAFWRKHVFKKEGDQFVYLVEVPVSNNQPDVYNLI